MMRTRKDHTNEKTKLLDNDTEKAKYLDNDISNDELTIISKKP